MKDSEIQQETQSAVSNYLEMLVTSKRKLKQNKSHAKENILAHSSIRWPAATANRINAPKRLLVATNTKAQRCMQVVAMLN